MSSGTTLPPSYLMRGYILLVLEGLRDELDHLSRFREEDEVALYAYMNGEDMKGEESEDDADGVVVTVIEKLNKMAAETFAPPVR
ncbi:hypothetical protein TW65_01538 [Stemphylium lycopersici]|nr:hypothetical protein TW65_01538 [Stemphylium lycopersici]